MTSPAPDAASDEADPQHRHPAEAGRAGRCRAIRPSGHEGEEGREGRARRPTLEPVALDERHGEPVVGGALGEGRREDDHADEQGARLEPGRSVPPPGGLGAASRRSRPSGAGSAGRHQAGTTSSTTTTPARCTVSGTSAPTSPRRPARRHDGAAAEGGVEVRHHRAAEVALDVGALEVHRDVPDADAQADEERARPPRPPARAVGVDDQPDRQQADDAATPVPSATARVAPIRS